MSANSWACCPACTLRAEKAKDAACRKAIDAYGKVPMEEYMRLADEAQAPLTMTADFREDWQIGISESGLFCVAYRGECQKAGCHFIHTFKHEQQLDCSKPRKDSHES